MRTNGTPLSFDDESVRPHAGERLDVFLAAVLERSRTHVQGLLKQGLVQMKPASARAQASYRLRAGDSVMIEAGPAEVVQTAPAAEAIPLDIIYEDDALLALNKQPGLVVHPAVGHWTGTLVNALMHHCGSELAGRGGGERLGIVHRLDKDTSGVMLVAKTDEAHERLALAFAERKVKKVYRALCRGVFRRPFGELKGAIGRHPIHRKKMAVSRNPERSRSAWTDYRVLFQGRQMAEVECVLHTGRTHQIRVHLSHLGNPICGDTLYSTGAAIVVNGIYPARQMLHAWRMEIAHPLTGKPLSFEAALPEDYSAMREALLQST
jgi:23S rRNA pseudouridine1911/1915/1917 synthase